MRIWKYELRIDDEQTILMPRGAKGLTVQWQRKNLCIWCMVDEINPLEPRKVIIYGTGHPMRFETGDYVGTFQMHDGALVFHVFMI